MKILSLISGGLVLFLILLISFLAILPKIINLEPVKKEVLAHFSEKTGGEINFKRIDLLFLPRPHAVIQQTSLSIGEKAQVTIHSMVAYPKIVSLLRGQFQIDELRIEAPDLNIRFLKQLDHERESFGPPDLEAILEKVGVLLAPFSASSADSMVIMKKGRLTIVDEDGKIISFLDIHGRIHGATHRLKFDLSCNSNPWQGITLKALLSHEGEKAEGIFDLNLDAPRITMSGKLLMDRIVPKIRLDLEAREMDIGSIREAALAVAGDVPNIRKVFNILKGGRVPMVTFRAQGNRVADLGKLENMTFKGRLRDAVISVPGIELDLDQVTGEAVISSAVLEGKNLEARMGNSRGRDGRMRLGLSGEDAPFYLDIAVDSDLAQVPPILKRVIGKESFLREMNLVEGLEGKATGRLVLGESLTAIKAGVHVKDFNLLARYKRIPYPIQIKGGHFSYNKNGIGADHLHGRLGNSVISHLTGRMVFKKTPFFEVLNGKLMLSLEELYPWITSFNTWKIPENIKGVKGILTCSRMSLKGPLLQPENWHFEAAGDLRDIVLDWPLFPDPIKMKKGDFHAIEDTENHKLTLRDTQIAILDTALNMSGVFKDYLKGLNECDVRFRGEMGSESNRWISDLVDLPPEFMLRAPLSISAARFTRGKGSKTSFTGDLLIKNGPDLHIDMIKSPEEFTIRNFMIKDDESKASFTLDIKDRALNLRFLGHITKSTSDRIFVESHLPAGWIKGDLRAHILMDHPMRSTAQGKLNGGDIRFPEVVGSPLHINTISLNSEKDHLRVEAADLNWGEKDLDLEGEVHFSKAGFHFDLDLSSDGLNWSHLKEIFEKDKKDKKVEQGRLLWGYPVEGMLRLKSDFFQYGQFTWTPFHAEILIHSDVIHVKVKEAKLCGISTPGIIKVTPRGLSLEFKTGAENQQLEPAINCLSEGKEKIAGFFDLKGDFKAQGKLEELPNSLTGNFELVARDGRIFKNIALSSILNFLNATEVLFGRYPGIGKKGMGYKAITMKGSLQNNRLHLKEAVMDGDSMELACQGRIDLIGKELDLTVIVAPLKTVDRAVKVIPVVRGILAGTLVTIPLKVTGDYAHPKVSRLPPSEVGKGLLGIMERTFKLPVKIIEPVFPKREKNNHPSQNSK